MSTTSTTATVATAAPTIVDDLGGLDQLTWVFTAYMLATTVSAAMWGKLSDLLGRRRTFLTAITLFVIGSLIMAYNLWRTIRGDEPVDAAEQPRVAAAPELRLQPAE